MGGDALSVVAHACKPYPSRFPLHLGGFVVNHTGIWWASGLHGKLSLKPSLLSVRHIVLVRDSAPSPFSAASDVCLRGGGSTPADGSLSQRAWAGSINVQRWQLACSIADEHMSI